MESEGGGGNVEGTRKGWEEWRGREGMGRFVGFLVS